VLQQDLDRAIGDVFCAPVLHDALVRLNPEIHQDHLRVMEIDRKLQSVVRSCYNDGLLSANQEFYRWLSGRQGHSYIGDSNTYRVRLIDFDTPENNVFQVAREVSFRTPTGKTYRYDIVLFVNGMPLVVGELKSPVDKNTPWSKGAAEVTNVYQKESPEFFVPNLFSFATEGKEFRYGAIEQDPSEWMPWLSTTAEDPPIGINAVLGGMSRLLNPKMLLLVLENYILYRQTSRRGVEKIVPRYPQVEAVESILIRARDTSKKQGLIWHHQGSGKTLVMAFAAARIRQDPAMDGATVLAVFDRIDLVQQAQYEFSSVGLDNIHAANNRQELRQMIANDTRGIILTTIFRFDDAGVVNDRSNIIVLVDEAHRTQDGDLGSEMRHALPNATFIGLTGTPISVQDRDTWTSFGDSSDPDSVLNHYSVERSIKDGATLPIVVDTRHIAMTFDGETLDRAFDSLVEEFEIEDEGKKELLKFREVRKAVTEAAPRVNAICQDILLHYRSRVAPLGLKAQIVVSTRAMCDIYYRVLSDMIQEDEEAAVVISPNKDDEAELREWERTSSEELAIRNRFLDPHDNLKFLIVTSKLLAGFDAPLEGVMYLDKNLKGHTLFQAVTRTNRRYTNKDTGQEKRFGLVVDYVGIGKELVDKIEGGGSKKKDFNDTDDLFEKLTEHINTCETIIDGTDDLQEAKDALTNDTDTLLDFKENYLTAEGIYEFLSPHALLADVKSNYRFLSQVYNALRESTKEYAETLRPLGHKTRDLIDAGMTSVLIQDSMVDQIHLDANLLERVKNMRPTEVEGLDPETQEDVLRRIQDKVTQRLMEEGGLRTENSATLSKRVNAVQESLERRLISSEEALLQIIDLLQSEDGDVFVRNAHIAEAVEDVCDIYEMASRQFIDRTTRYFQTRNNNWKDSDAARRAIQLDMQTVFLESDIPINTSFVEDLLEELER
jgi:type I restriction enzyme R subunit